MGVTLVSQTKGGFVMGFLAMLGLVKPRSAQAPRRVRVHPALSVEPLEGRFCPSAPGCIPPPEGMVGWWAGDGSAVDLANHYDGTLLGGAAYDAGEVSQAFSLDGVDDAVNIADTGSRHLDGLSQLTIDAWINPTALDDEAIVSKYDSRLEISPAGVSYWFAVEDGKLQISVFERTYNPLGQVDPIGAVYTSAAPVISMGQWTHVAGVWHGGSRFELYANGQEVAGTLLSYGTLAAMADNDVPVNIGRFEAQSFSNHGQPFGFFNGRIDEVEIHDRALSPATIAAICNAGSAGKCKGQRVAIDIKPGSDVNPINLGSRGVIPVAILSTADFDATQVDVRTVTLGDWTLGGRVAPVHFAVEDVDGDGRLDLILHFRTQELVAAGALDANSTELILSGTLLDGSEFFGTDVVRIVP
jgi:Concanavalin A-like lectin/glucanases superfamily